MLDELVKIGQAAEKDEKKKSWKGVLSTAALAGAGIGVGATGAQLLGQHLAKKQVTPELIKGVKFILPILAGAAVVLGNELRQMKSDKYKKVEGWKGEET